MQVGVNIIFLGHGCELPIIEKPNDRLGVSDPRKPHLIARADSVDVFVETIMEQIISIAAARVGRAYPDRSPRILARIGSPRHFQVRGNS